MLLEIDQPHAPEAFTTFHSAIGCRIPLMERLCLASRQSPPLANPSSYWSGPAGQRLLLCERPGAGHPGAAEDARAGAVHRHRRAPWRRRRGGLLPHRQVRIAIALHYLCQHGSQQPHLLTRSQSLITSASHFVTQTKAVQLVPQLPVCCSACDKGIRRRLTAGTPLPLQGPDGQLPQVRGLLLPGHRRPEGCWRGAVRGNLRGFPLFVGRGVVRGLFSGAGQGCCRAKPRILSAGLHWALPSGAAGAWHCKCHVQSKRKHCLSCSTYAGIWFLSSSHAQKHGKYYSVNVPLRDGTDDATFHRLFKPIMQGIMDTFQPGTVVLQCGGRIRRNCLLFGCSA